MIKDDEGTRLQSSVGHQLSYDTRSPRFDPRDGEILSLSNEFAGVGGDVRFLKSTLGAAYYQPILENLTAAIKTEVGHIIGLGQDTRVSDRFFIRPDSLRGFKFAGVGPRDADTDDALGGKQFYTGTVEVSFPLGLPDELQIRGRVFTDVGAAWDVDNAPDDLEDSSSPRVSVGVGWSWMSPFGPFLIDLGWALVEEDFDETEKMRFSFGTRF